jgi:tRNA(fMet)-specific endonuclease VapC
MSSLQTFDANYIVALTDPRSDARRNAFHVILPTLEIVVPCIAYGEAWYGLARGRPDRTAKKRKLFEEFIVPLRILWLDQNTLELFRSLNWTLARKGTPLPMNDIWIAALCLQHDALLITSDSDLKNIPGLEVRNW